MKLTIELSLDEVKALRWETPDKQEDLDRADAPGEHPAKKKRGACEKEAVQDTFDFFRAEGPKDVLKDPNAKKFRTFMIHIDDADDDLDSSDGDEEA